MGLQHANAVVIVYDKARKAVSLSVHQAVAIGLLTGSETVGFAQFIGPLQHPEPKIRLRRVLVKAEHPHGNGANLVMAAAEEFAIGRTDTHQVSLGGMPYHLGHSPGEHPGVKTQEGFLPVGFQDNLIHSSARG